LNSLPPLKILILNYEYPPLGGGAGIITKKLAEEFSSAGHLITILTTWFPGEDEVTENGKFKIIRLKSLRKRTDRSNPIEMGAWMLKAIQWCKKNIKKGDFDVCQANFTLPGGPVAYYLKKKYQLPFVILSHGHDIPWYFPKQMFYLHLLCYWPIKFVCKASDRNILLTTDMKKIADNFLGKNYQQKNLIIHNGMDLSNIDWGLKNDELKVIFVGRMVEQKDPLKFLEVVSQLNKKNIKATYQMLGDGPLMDKVVQKIQSDKLVNVHLLGKVDHSEVIKIMEKSHIMIQPSLHEAMSVSVLEAISCGVYVITTPVSGNKQIILDGLNGKLVGQENIQGIVNEVERFFTHELSKRKGAIVLDSYKQLNDQFGWQSVMNLYGNVFREILKIQ
jgi:glycosyltransferase involved in cell wall biosynthesis